MSKEISPVTGVIIAVIVLAIVIVVGWKVFLAPKGSSGTPGMKSGMNSGMNSGGQMGSPGMTSGGMSSGGTAPRSGGGAMPR